MLNNSRPTAAAKKKKKSGHLLKMPGCSKPNGIWLNFDKFCSAKEQDKSSDVEYQPPYGDRQ